MNLPPTKCLASVDCDKVSQTDIISEHEIDSSQEFALFLSGESIIDGRQETLLPGILKDHHHRSVQLLNEGGDILSDVHGNIYSTLRLKGNGLYSGPDGEKFRDTKGQVRNLNNDDTGYVRGLQALHEIQTSMEHAQKLLDMGVQTEVPLAAYKLNEIILQTRLGVWERLSMSDAIDFCHLPEEYKDMPFAIRVDAMGVNNRLKDFINPHEMFHGKNLSENQTRELFLNDTWQYLLEEKKRGLIDLNITEDRTQQNIIEVLIFTTQRIFENLAKVHKNQGVHGRMTPDNMTMDGKFIDYDTLQWLPKGEDLQKGKEKDIEWTKEALSEYGKALCGHQNLSLDISQNIKTGLNVYKNSL
jgi:hypothetical protein